MSTFDYGASQKEAQAIFGNLTAEEAAQVVLFYKGHEAEVPLSFALDKAEDFLRRCSGSSYRLRFEPEPVGHIAFKSQGTKGCGNQGWVAPVAHSRECKELVSRAIREYWTSSLEERGLTRTQALAAWKAARGHEGILGLVYALIPVLKACPTLSDRGLREMGWRPNHPKEGRAIEIVRSLLGA